MLELVSSVKEIEFDSFHFECEIFEQMEWARKAPEDGEGLKKGNKTFDFERERGLLRILPIVQLLSEMCRSHLPL